MCFFAENETIYFTIENKCYPLQRMIYSDMNSTTYCVAQLLGTAHLDTEFSLKNFVKFSQKSRFSHSWQTLP